MTAYAIFIRERSRNAAELQTYAELVTPLLGSRALPCLPPTAIWMLLRGAAPEGVVMASFPTMEAARAFYDSPEYQVAVKHRFLGADYRSFIIEGIE